MGDFQQRGTITTLPRLVEFDYPEREVGLVGYAARTPPALVIPCLASEMDRPALEEIVGQLACVPYLDTVVISLDAASESDYQRALGYFRQCGQRTVVVWNDAPVLHALSEEIESQTVCLGPKGKGKAVWMAFGYLLGEGRVSCVALHDADLVGYRRTLLDNLLYPILHPGLDFSFCKAYYARFSDRLHGRVTRLLMRPLLQALSDVVGRNPYLSYLAAFRYPLAGELAMDADLLRWVRMPGDWGLEMGVLFELIRHRSSRRICQVDVADRFEHKHQELSPEDPTKGLHRMAVDIVKHLLRTLAAAGAVLPEGSFKSMRVAYQRYAEDAVADSHALSIFNGFVYDRHEEEKGVETFGRALGEGCEQFLCDPLGTPALPNWARVQSAMPGIGRRLVQAVEKLDGILEPCGSASFSRTSTEPSLT
jgi:glucosyl-3-phosphoglycerate synthase